MTLTGIGQILGYFSMLLVVTKPAGLYMARVFEGQRTFLHPLLRPLERFIYRIARVDEHCEQHWTRYTGSLLAFSLLSLVAAYIIQRAQKYFPLNPSGFGTAGAPNGATAVGPDLAFNTAVSFMTNTNWQAYGGESTFSYFVQMTAFTVQNFASAAAGIAIAIAVIRGFSRQQTKTIGNFWVDLTRAIVYVLLPFSIPCALVLCSQGVIQNLHPYVHAQTLEGVKQIIPQGPVASQEAIKLLGTNGGGFMNANSAHPYENPTPASNLLEMLLILVIPAGLTYTFGKMVKDTRQGWAIFAAMSVLFLAGLFVTCYVEQAGNPILEGLGLQSEATALQPGGNMEGKEVRFGITSSALFATVTTDASCGAVNAMHDSFAPISGLVLMFNIMTGEVIFGGTGSGLYGMLLYAVIAVFISGLMVGRTPEYLGKKIEKKEVKMAMFVLIATAFSILVFTALSCVVRFHPCGYWNPQGATTANLGNGGPHGFSEILYAYTSGAGNNGSAFAGLNANSPWYNLTIALAMLIGRFFYIIPLLALAGSLAGKKMIPASSGTLPTHGALFVGLLAGTVLIVGALTFFPALSLGALAEHFLSLACQLTT